MNLRFLDKAEEEMTVAARIYEDQAAGLGERFLDEVEGCVDLLLDRPFIGRPIGEFRRFPLRKFPFTLGDDCDTEYKTNADVCVKISDVNLDCRKNYSDEYYRSCEVTVQIIAVDHTLMLTSSAKPKLDTQGMVHIPDAVIHPPKMKITAYTLMNLTLNP